MIKWILFRLNNEERQRKYSHLNYKKKIELNERVGMRWQLLSEWDKKQPFRYLMMTIKWNDKSYRYVLRLHSFMCRWITLNLMLHCEEKWVTSAWHQF